MPLGCRDFRGLDEAKLWCRREGADLRRVAIEQLQTFEACGIELVINILSKIAENCWLRQAKPRSPFSYDRSQVRLGEAVIARVAKDGGEIERGIGFPQRSTADGPEGKDKRLSSKPNPLFREIERLILRAIHLQRRVADQEPSVGMR